MDEARFAELIEAAKLELFELTVLARQVNLGAPGVQGTGRPPSLKQLGDSTRRTIEIAINARRHVSPEVFSRLVACPKLTQEERTRYVLRYTRAYTSWRFFECLEILSRALLSTIEDADAAAFEATFEVNIRAHVRGYALARQRRVDPPQLKDLQSLMRQSDEFGWITDVVSPGFRVTAPSRAVCDLLGLSQVDVDGSYLLEDPLRGSLVQILANPFEWLMVMAMLVNSFAEQWAGDPRLAVPAAAHVGNFFRWLESYVTANLDAARHEINSSPDRLVDGRSSRTNLLQCLDATLGMKVWPTFNPTHWNTMRMHVNRHPLLLRGQIARFAKIGRPIESEGKLVGFEVSWQEEKADAVANKLKREILHNLHP
jgi:hypothetical protein